MDLFTIRAIVNKVLTNPLLVRRARKEMAGKVISETARYREDRIFRGEEIGESVIAESAKNCGFKIVDYQEDRVKLFAGGNRASCGEDIVIQIVNNDDENVISIESRCQSFQMMAWGKNRTNVCRLFSEIRNMLGDRIDTKAAFYWPGVSYTFRK